MAVVISVFKCQVAQEVSWEAVARLVVPEVIATTRLMLKSFSRLEQDAWR